MRLEDTFIDFGWLSDRQQEFYKEKIDRLADDKLEHATKHDMLILWQIIGIANSKTTWMLEQIGDKVFEARDVAMRIDSKIAALRRDMDKQQTSINWKLDRLL